MDLRQLRTDDLVRRAEELDLAGRHEEAEHCRRRALAVVEAKANALVAGELWKAGAFAEATTHLDRAIALAPDDGWRIRRAVLLPQVAESVEQIAAVRHEVEVRLAALADEDLAVADPAGQIDWTCYLLSYHGGHANGPLMKLFHRVCAQAAPQLTWVAPHCAAPRRPGKPRVGFVSWYFCEHTVARLFTGLIAGIDSAGFEVTVFAIEGSDDFLRRMELPGKTVVGLTPDLEAARRTVAAAQLDVLIYLDLGMDPFTLFLAHARLAPVQAVLWGHPDTTGIPAIDVFLTCDAMEPEDGENHYGERLVRLPGIATWYPRPPAPATTPCAGDYGLPEDAPLYLCPQTPQKFHPDFDPLIRRILEANDRAQLVLTAGWSAKLMERVRQRIVAPCPALAERIHILGPMNRDRFIGLLQVADVLLDPPHYSGGNTSLEAFAVGAPVVTWPGRFMRARHTYGFYKLMGLTECVAADLDGYVALAVALGRDPGKRRALRQIIAERSSVLYEDEMPVRALEAFIASVSRGGP